MTPEPAGTSDGVQPPETEFVAVVESFGDVLRAVPPHVFSEVPEQVQGAVTAALNWFVGESAELAARHCVGIGQPLVPDVLVVCKELSVSAALRPTSFRGHVTQLRRAVQACEGPAYDALGSLPSAQWHRVRDGKEVEVMGPLLDDFIHARAWMNSYGSKAGFWSYYWMRLCLMVAALEGDACRAELAAVLRESAENRLREAFLGQRTVDLV